MEADEPDSEDPAAQRLRDIEQEVEQGIKRAEATWGPQRKDADAFLASRGLSAEELSAVLAASAAHPDFDDPHLAAYRRAVEQLNAIATADGEDPAFLRTREVEREVVEGIERAEAACGARRAEMDAFLASRGLSAEELSAALAASVAQPASDDPLSALHRQALEELRSIAELEGGQL